MSIVKVIEVLAQSSESWEDAARNALDQASRTVRNIRSLYVKEMQLVMKDGEPQFRLDAKISFEVEPDHHPQTRIEEVSRATSKKRNGG